MSLLPKPQLSFDDWLADERAAIEGRTEYIGGEIFAMTGATAAHIGIVTNQRRFTAGRRPKKSPNARRWGESRRPRPPVSGLY
jgi:hypothetical protein